MIEAIKNGFAGPDMKAEWDALQERMTTLQAKLDSADEPPPLLHPGMAELYRHKVTDLAKALEHPDTRTEAAESSARTLVIGWREEDGPTVGPPQRRGFGSKLMERSIR